MFNSNISDNDPSISITPDLFWHAVNILITKPHVVNKRAWGCKELARLKCKATKTWKTLSLSEKLQYRGNVDLFFSELTICMGTQLILDEDSESDLELILMELLPRNYGETHALQLIALIRKENAVIFHDVTPMEHNQNLCPNFSYRFFLQNGIITLDADVDETLKPYKWLMTTVLPQVIKWSSEATSETQQSINKSLALVSHDKYYTKYNILKEKYGKELVKIWPECTDPSKFVYEDIAIATYLLLQWDENCDACDVQSQTFVDLGCGNGLLVYILTMEGNSGYGIDVRKRKIWDMYPRNIRLLEKTITPSNIDTFTEVDWIIGNHSDELTPWIPVIAAKSSYKCKFFLLPCCAYNFDGTKYQRKNSSKSQYTEYLAYIQNLSEDCGFQTYTDRLKIPSTKRICFVGKKRKYRYEEFNKYCENIDALIKSSTCSISSLEMNTVENFKARAPTEIVRNCTQIDKSIADSIISCVTKYLLEGCNSESLWSPGKTIDISEVVSLLSPDMLKVLKSECGGLQTLLKNNHHIFNVRNGKIQLQYPKTIEEMYKSKENNKRFKSNVKLKVKECWFVKNHPQGCPLKDADCSFSH